MNARAILETGESISAPAQGQANPCNHILVVDDDTCIRELTAGMLAASGYQVDTAEDGAAAWEALHASSYDLLITDNNMPKLSGIDLVRKLRSAHSTLPVVLLSGAIPAEALDRNSSLQLAASLPKPFTMDELVATVERTLRAPQNACEERLPFRIWRSQPPIDSLSV